MHYSVQARENLNVKNIWRCDMHLASSTRIITHRQERGNNTMLPNWRAFGLKKWVHFPLFFTLLFLVLVGKRAPYVVFISPLLRSRSINFSPAIESSKMNHSKSAEISLLQLILSYRTLLNYPKSAEISWKWISRTGQISSGTALYHFLNTVMAWCDGRFAVPVQNHACTVKTILTRFCPLRKARQMLWNT